MTLKQLMELRESIGTSIRQLEDLKAKQALSTNQQRALDKYMLQAGDLDEQIAEQRATDSVAAEQRQATVRGIADGTIGTVVRSFPDAGGARPTPGSAPASGEVRGAEQRALSEAEQRAVGDFRNYLRTGETRTLSATSNSGGGYIVPNPLVGPLTEAVRKADPILDLAGRFNMRGGNSVMSLPHKATHGAVFVTDDFTTERTAEQTNPTFGGLDLSCIDYSSDQRAAAHWISSTPGSEDLVMRWIVEDLYEQLGVDIAVGTGEAGALGLFAATEFFAGVDATSDTAVTNTDFLKMYTALNPKFRTSAVWLLNSATFASTLAMEYPNTDTPLVQWVNGQPTILGRPVRETSSAPEVADGAVPIAFGDISQAYAVGEHYGPEVLVDKLTKTPLIRYVGLARLGGSPWNPDACVLLQCGGASA